MIVLELGVKDITVKAIKNSNHMKFNIKKMKRIKDKSMCLFRLKKIIKSPKASKKIRVT